MNALFAPALATLLILLSTSPLCAQTEIWGDHGSAWTPQSLLPEFSYAGYHQGEQALPTPTADVSVKDFGAVGDGESDDTSAFAKAIAESPGKTILIPKGTYLLSDRLRVTEAGTVLLGEGMEETILYFQRGLQEIEPTKAFTGGGFETNNWSWSGGIITLGEPGLRTGAKTGITAPAERGDTSIVVENPSLFEVGGAFMIVQNDDAEHSLIRYLYRDEPGDISLITTHTLMQPVTIVKIEGDTVTLNQPLRFEIRSEWEPLIARIAHPSQEIGISDFTIRFPERQYQGHWIEDGLNGFAIEGVNNWARNIRIQNCDSGAFLTGTWCTAEGLVVEGTRKPHSSGNSGHHGIVLTGRSCLLKNFKIDTKFFHDVTVSGGSIGNVFSRGSAVDLSIDHHRRAPYENLFTQIYVGEGTRVWSSGGTKGLGYHTAAGATFWNIDSKNRFPLPTQDFGSRGLIFVGLNSETIRQRDLLAGWYYEKIRPSSLEPANLYEAQLAKRQGGMSVAELNPEPLYHPWSNTSGSVIEAEFLGLNGDLVKLRLREGSVHDYPLANLAPDSQALAKRLAEAGNP